jgi:hypothetical protein
MYIHDFRPRLFEPAITAAGVEEIWSDRARLTSEKPTDVGSFGV